MNPDYFGKGMNGNRSWLHRIVLFPYLALRLAVWHFMKRIVSKEDKCNFVCPGVWLGRRPLDGDFPPNVRTVVDLTCEYTATPEARKLNYICLPTLDGLAPNAEAFGNLIERLTPRQEDIYIHCAAGHGRSAMVAIALVVARGHATTIEDAESLVQKARPKVSLHASQRMILDNWFHTTYQTHSDNESKVASGLPDKKNKSTSRKQFGAVEVLKCTGIAFISIAIRLFALAFLLLLDFGALCGLFRAFQVAPLFASLSILFSTVIFFYWRPLFKVEKVEHTEKYRSGNSNFMDKQIAMDWFFRSDSPTQALLDLGIRIAFELSIFLVVLIVVSGSLWRLPAIIFEDICKANSPLDLLPYMLAGALALARLLQWKNTD